jgi:hypothetical protein
LLIVVPSITYDLKPEECAVDDGDELAAARKVDSVLVSRAA